MTDSRIEASVLGNVSTIVAIEISLSFGTSSEVNWAAIPVADRLPAFVRRYAHVLGSLSAFGVGQPFNCWTVVFEISTTRASFIGPSPWRTESDSGYVSRAFWANRPRKREQVPEENRRGPQ